MDAKFRDDLFRRYAAFLEKRLEEGAGSEGAAGARGAAREEALIVTATALLGACDAEPGQRFRAIRFYDVVENALRSLRGASLWSLEAAFSTLETVCTNLLLFPWKKEFRCIKTFTGPYVYQLQSAVCESDLRSLLRSMGYSRDQDLQYVIREQHGGSSASTHHLRQLAFELLLAQAECRLLRERGGGVSELEAVELRRSSGDEIPRLSARPSEPERTHLRRGGRPSKSVDVTDGAGHWHQANKPVLKTSLSLRKEPLFVDAEEDAKDEIIRPGSFTHPMGEYFPNQPPEPYPYHLSSLDEVDLYTERGISGRHTPSRMPSRESWESWTHKSHGLKCQGCELSSQTLSSCQTCDAILCPSCHGSDPAPCCGYLDVPKNSRPLDGYVPVKDKLSVYSGSHPHAHTHPLSLSHAHSHSPLLDKPAIGAKLYQSKPSAPTAASSAGGSRCGFCNKPGATHTCLNCSKVSCETCMSLYMGDVCTRKSLHHNFVPNHQLNYKSSTISHLVYR